LYCDGFAYYRRNIVKVSVFYGDIKFSTFTQNEAYDVRTLLSKTSILCSYYFACIVL